MNSIYKGGKTHILTTSSFLKYASACLKAIFIRALLEYSEALESNLLYGLLLSFGIFAAELVRSWSFTMSWAMNYRTGIRLKGAVLALAFRKILRLKETKDVSTGEVNSLANVLRDIRVLFVNIY